MKNKYYEQFCEFIDNYKNMRSYFGLEDMVKGYKVLPYDKYLDENPQIVETITKEMCSTGGASLLIGFTGSGKSHCLISCANSLRGKAREDGKIPIFVKINPKKKQCEQEALTYENVVAIYGTKQFDKQDILEHKILSIVYDKTRSFENFIKNEDIQKRFYPVLIVDECHALISHQYRKHAIREIQSLVKYVQESGGNVIYTTATFSNCYVLDVKTIHFCHPKSFGNLGKIEEITCPRGVKKEDFILNNIVNTIKQGFIPCVRLNNIQLMEDLKENLLRQKGLNIAIVNAANQNESDVARTIVEESVLPDDYKCFVFSCLLDESTNIEGIRNEKGEIEQPDNLCPMFYMDALNTNLDNVSQFVARFRFKLKKMVLMVDKHNFEDGDLCSLKSITKQMGERYMREYESFVLSLKGAKLRYNDEKRIKEEIEWLLNQENDFGEKNHRGYLFFYENGEMHFDLNDAFHRIYSLYMDQFFVKDNERRKYLERCFQCKVRKVLYQVEENEEQMVDYSGMRFDNFCKELIDKDSQGQIGNDLEAYITMLEMDKDFGAYMEKMKHDKRYDSLIKLSRYQSIAEGGPG